jgi:CheY-like chemotaxis protein
VRQLEKLLRRLISEDVELVTALASDLRPVRVDPASVEQILVNLAVNARDAMPLGGSVTIVARQEIVTSPAGGAPKGLNPGGYLRISVIDTGSGMDEATLAKATEPFFTTKGPGKGTGLGLSMVHGLAAQSGGALDVLSVPGQGTTVELWLPQALPDSPEMRPAAPAPERHNPLHNGAMRPCTVLVVDDDALVCTGTAAMLEDLGHSVIEASSGLQALDALHSDRRRIDLVITDHAMPGMTGLELASQIRKTYPDLAIILATGYAEIPESMASERPLPRLSKPFRQDELAAAIADVAGPPRAQRTPEPLSVA